MHESSTATSLTSPLEEVTTVLSRRIYGGSVTKSFVATRSLAATSQPTSIVNGNFDYPYYTGSGLWMRNCNDGAGCLINDIDPSNGITWLDGTKYQWRSGVSGFDFSKFGWKSTQTGTKGFNGVITPEDRKGAVELQKDYYTGNMYAEIVPFEADAAIYEDISTTPGAVYHWSLQHASQSTLQNGDCVQVVIGGTVQQAKRTVSNGHGDTVGNVGTNICTTVSNGSINGRSVTSRNHDGQWETYEGDYLVPASRTTTRFSFNSLIQWTSQGNIVDNIKFYITYPLRYHINGGYCTSGGAESTCMPFTGKDGDFYHNYYTPGTSVSLAGNSGSQDANWNSSTIKRDGYVFAGWSASPSNPTSFNGNTITSYTVGAPGGDVYAVWIPLTHISWEKVDKVTGNHIGGATFTVTTQETGAKTTVVDNGTGDSDPRAGYITYNQPVKRYGHYVVQETSPPSVYFNDSDSATIYTDGSSPAAAVLKDTPKITPTIRKYVELKDNGYVLTLNFTGKQIVGTGGSVSMTNTVVKDTLTQWVDPVDLQSNGTGATISAVDTTGKPVEPPKGTSVKYDANSKTMTWDLGNFVPINGYTYSISFKIKSTKALSSDATARQSLTNDTKHGPDTGDATTGDISAGQHGWYTNTQATLTYDAKYSTGGTLGQKTYTNMGILVYKKPIVPGYRWWYKNPDETTTHFYDAGSDNKDQTRKVFSCAAYINESVQGTDGYTKSVSGTTQTTATDIAKLKNSSLAGSEFTTWDSLSHSLNSPETQEKYDQIVAELQSACDASNRQTTAASTASTTPTLSGDMQKAYAQGGTLLITRSKQNTTVSAPSKSMTYSVRPVDYMYEHYSRKLSIDSPGNDWHLEGNFQCGNGYTSDGNSNANNLYCVKVVVGNWQTNDDVSSIKASYNKQGQSFTGTGSDASYKWDTGTRQFRGYYCATNGAWASGEVDASSYLNGCGTTSNELAPSYDLNRTNIHLYHYMMLNMLCDKTDFTSYYNKVKNYVMKNDSTYQGSGLSSSWQGSLISKPSSNENVVQFPRVTALLSGIVRQNSDATITNLGTTGVDATTLANNLRAIGVDASSTSDNTAMMNNYLTAYTASKDPVYTKECPYSCVADRTLTGTGSISSDGSEYSTDRTGFYNRASDGKGAIIGNMNEADAFSSIFYRNNAWNQVAMSVLRPISSNGLTYNGSAAKTTTVLKNTTGTPWNTALSLSSIAPNSSSSSMFYGNDTIASFMSPTAQPIYEAPNNATVSGEQNIFKVKSAWASETNQALKFDVSWEFDTQNAVNVPTTAGFGDNGTLAASNINETVINATSDGRCWFISKVSGYPTDTITVAHDYSGYGSNVIADSDNPIFPGFKSGFNVTFIRSSSE